MFLEKPSDGTRNGNGKVFLFCTVLVPPLRRSLIIWAQGARAGDPLFLSLEQQRSPGVRSVNR